MTLRKNNLNEIMAKEYFSSFCRVILNQKLGKMHEEWIDSIMRGDKHVCLVAARGHFKTTILSVAFPLWIMYRTPSTDRKTILVCSGSLKQSTEIMDRIKETLMENTVLREVLYPKNIHETKWSETQIKTKRGHRVICVPFGDGARGFHSNFTISDDVLTDETTNVEQSKKTFYSVVFPTTQSKKGRHIVVGTPISFVDLLADLESKETFRTMKYPAVKVDSHGSWLEPQFPEHFSFPQLREIRDTMPAHLWAREYMCRPVSDSTALFPYETHIAPAIDLWSQMTQARMAKVQDPKAIPTVVPKFLGIDIAASKETGADFTVITEVQKMPDEPMYVASIVRHHGFETQEIVNLHQANQYNRILIEKTGLGQGYVQDLQQHDATRSVVVDFKTTRESKEALISRLEVLLKNHQIALPNNEILVQELMQMGMKIKNGKETYESLGRHDDTVISLALAVQAAEKYSSIASIAFV